MASTAPELKKIFTKDACPPAANAYSQAVYVAPFLHVSGQIPAKGTGDAEKPIALVEGDITEKTKACFENLKAILAEAGSSLDKVIKCQVFLTDMSNFAAMNDEYKRQFGDHRPARSCVAVYQLPMGVPVEIECIAIV